ncbi:MAG TPA: hypothetical protein VJ778_05920, partial [Burkholderiales bacterium]|nr:hypothetical protein [Burkholderiales bacterium]
MKRRGFLAAALAILGTALAQPRHHRVGFITSASPDAFRPALQALVAALAEHGYVDGKNLVLEQRWSE